MNNNLSLQWIKVYYPNKLKKNPQEVRTSSFTISTINIGNSIIKHLEQKINKKTIKKNYTPMVSGSIPIIIQSYYIAKGKGYEEQSLYSLNYFCGVSINETSSSNISFSNLIFTNRLSINDNPSKVLDMKWNELQKSSNW